MCARARNYSLFYKINFFLDMHKYNYKRNCKIIHRKIKLILNVIRLTYFRDAYRRSKTRLSTCWWRQPTHAARTILSNSASKRAYRRSHAKFAGVAITQLPSSLIMTIMTMPLGGNRTPCTRASNILIRSISPFI